MRQCNGLDQQSSQQTGKLAGEPAIDQARESGVEGLRLALIGLPAAVAEPVTMVAEILGWQVLCYPAGPAMPPPVRACLAMLPPCADTATPPLVLWSQQSNLNEHISRAGLSIMDQPLCVTRVEQMLQTLGCDTWTGRSQ